MNVKELYSKFSMEIPDSLRLDFDNDGLMCSCDTDREVRRVLCSLDVTDAVIDYAVSEGFDLIISHHPLIFSKIGAVNPDDYVARRVIKLIGNKISVFSFHTRADAFEGGVNTRLAAILGIKDAVPFGPAGEEMGRIGYIGKSETLPDFASSVKEKLGSGAVLFSGKNIVRRVAVLGGDGKDFVSYAKAAGADTYVSGRISYNMMIEAEEMGLNLIEAGHFHTEKHIADVFSDMVKRFAPEVYTESVYINHIKML